MAKYNTNNEVIKKQYEQFLELDERLSATTRYGKIKDLRKYEEVTGFKDFTTFNAEQALAFKETYKEATANTGKDIGYATIFRTLRNIKEFFIWLGQQRGYKSKIKISDTRAFNLTSREENIAKTKGFKRIPTIEQILKTIEVMPAKTEKDKRNQAMVAFTAVTGVRVNALISLQLRHVDEVNERVTQDPNIVKTKFGKAILTQFLKIDEKPLEIVLNWIKFLKEEKLFDLDAPLFPAMASGYDHETQNFVRDNLSDKHIQSTTTVRDIFKTAFQNAGIEYFHPHTFRYTLATYGQKKCTTPEQYKAFSQNLGHKSPLTTFTSYGEVYPTRQCELIKAIGEELEDAFSD